MAANKNLKLLTKAGRHILYALEAGTSKTSVNRVAKAQEALLKYQQNVVDDGGTWPLSESKGGH